MSAVIERPVDAEPWSDNAREQFREDWYAKFTGNGPKAGGTPILEDGMKLTRIDFKIAKAQVRMPNGPLKTVGEHTVSVVPHTDVLVEVKVVVIGETD